MPGLSEFIRGDLNPLVQFADYTAKWQYSGGRELQVARTSQDAIRKASQGGRSLTSKLSGAAWPRPLQRIVRSHASTFILKPRRYQPILLSPLDLALPLKRI
jgi:hypothetical protein